MKISIITVSYNSENTIEDTIKSVLKQKDVDLEYILVDGRSNDNTLNIINKYKENYPDIVKYISEKDEGMYDAMNKGIEMANGDIIGILNSDDFYTNDYVLKDVLNNFNKNNIETCYGNILYVKQMDKYLYPYRYWKSGKPRSFKFGWMPPHPAFFVRKQVYEQYGRFCLDCGVNGDYELLLRFFQVHKVSSNWLNENLVYMRVGGLSDNGIKSRMNGIVNDKKAWFLNNIKPYCFTVYLKRIRKLGQYVIAKFMKKIYLNNID